MRRTNLWIACCALLVVAGCGAADQIGPPSPAELGTLCDPLTAGPGDTFPAAYRARRELFVRALQEEIIKTNPVAMTEALGRIAPCLRTDVVPESEARVYQVFLQAPGRTIGPFLIYPFKKGVIHLASLDPLAGAGAEILTLHTVLRGTELDMIAKRLVPSQEHPGRLQVYRLTNGLTLLWESPEYPGFDAVVLNPDWVLTLHQPAGEVLWHREGDAFRQVAARTYPSPLQAATEFVSALKHGDRAAAGRWATDPAVVAAGAGALGQLETSGWAAAAQAVERVEAFAWSEIPADLRGPDPAVTRVVLPSGPYQLVTTRSDSGWLVSAIEPPSGK